MPTLRLVADTKPFDRAVQMLTLMDDLITPEDIETLNALIRENEFADVATLFHRNTPFDANAQLILRPSEKFQALIDEVKARRTP